MFEDATRESVRLADVEVSAGLAAAGGMPALPALVWRGPLPGARPLSSMMLPMVRPDEGPEPGCECLPIPRGGWCIRAEALMESIRAAAVEDCVESAAAGGTPAAPCPLDEVVLPEVAYDGKFFCLIHSRS